MYVNKNNMINFTEQAPQSEPWIKIGSGFSSKSGKGFNIVIGNQVPKERGSKELVETVDSVELRPGDELYLGEATDREGKVVHTKTGGTVYRLQVKPRRAEVASEETAK